MELNPYFENLETRDNQFIWKGNNMIENKMYMSVDDVKSYLGISQSKAYGIIRSLNKELKDKGYITVQGKVSTAYFNSKVYAG